MFDDSKIQNIIYTRKNGEPIINDPEAIKSCKNEQSRDIIDNARLGSYDKFGNYIIIPDIKRELIAMPKLVYNVKQQNNAIVYEMKGSIPIFGDVFFKLTLKNGEAVLSLVENVQREANGYLEVYDEPLDATVYGAGGLPIDMVLRNFHVNENPDDFGKNIGLYDYNSILTRKVYLSLLSKELRDISKFDEKSAFDKMTKKLKESGEYGARVLNQFLTRLKDRPGIFEITDTQKYNKAVNEVLLSSLDIATTKQDKDNYDTKQVYLSVLNTRNENIDSYLEEANSKIDETRVYNIVDKATKDFNEENENKKEIEEFFDSLKDKKVVPTKRQLDKPILKQGQDERKEQEAQKKKDGEKDKDKNKSKEDKIKSILNKDKEKKKEPKKTPKKAKKTPAKKRLKPAKKSAKKSKIKRLKGAKKKKKSFKKAKNKKAKRRLNKGKAKNKKKRFKKAKSHKKAKSKGNFFKPKPPKSEKKEAKKQSKKPAKPAFNYRWYLINKFYDKQPAQQEIPVDFNYRIEQSSSQIIPHREKSNASINKIMEANGNSNNLTPTSSNNSSQNNTSPSVDTYFEKKSNSDLVDSQSINHAQDKTDSFNSLKPQITNPESLFNNGEQTTQDIFRPPLVNNNETMQPPIPVDANPTTLGFGRE